MKREFNPVRSVPVLTLASGLILLVGGDKPVEQGAAMMTHEMQTVPTK